MSNHSPYFIAKHNPLLYWMLNETSGTVAVNKGFLPSANGTYNSIPASAMGKTITPYKDRADSGAVELDGSADSVTTGHEEAFSFERTDAFTVMAWAKIATDASGGDMLVTKAASNSASRGWYVEFGSTGKPAYVLSHSLAANQSLWRAGTTDFRDGNYHHICVTYDGSETVAGIKFYVDGTLSEMGGSTNDTLAGNTIKGTTQLAVGMRGSGQRRFKGEVGEVVIFDRELSASEITEIYNDYTAPGSTLSYAQYVQDLPDLVSYLRLNQATGATVTNLSTGNNGTPSSPNAPEASSDTPITGDPTAGSLKFTRANQTDISLGDDPDWRWDGVRTYDGSPMTLIAWAKPTGNVDTDEYVIASYADDSIAEGWRMDIKNSTGQDTGALETMIIQGGFGNRKWGNPDTDYRGQGSRTSSLSRSTETLTIMRSSTLPARSWRSRLPGNSPT